MSLKKIRSGITFYSLVSRSKKYWKKSQIEPNKFTLQFRNDFVCKKLKKLFKLFKVEVDVKGYENLGNGPAILVGNHQDNIDAFIVIWGLKKQTEDKTEINKISTFIAKHDLQYKAKTRYPLNVINTFFLDRDNLKKSLETYNSFGRFVKENKTFGVIFPEGTRNREGKVGEFKPGVFKICKKELLPIIPFTINNSVSGTDFNRKKTLKAEIIFHKRIPANSLVTQNTISIAERVQNIVSSSFIEPEYEFKEYDSEKDIENSKAAIKWHKKIDKEAMKNVKKERREREHERKLLEAEEKENAKYEKYKLKMERKNQKKGRLVDEKSRKTDTWYKS